MGLHNSLDFNSLKKNISVYQISLQAYITHLWAVVFLTMWTLPAAPPSSGTRCQWTHYRLLHRSLCRWNALGCDSSSESSRPSPWSDSHWTDAASCGPSLGPTWRVGLGRDKRSSSPPPTEISYIKTIHFHTLSQCSTCIWSSFQACYQYNFLINVWMSSSH